MNQYILLLGLCLLAVLSNAQDKKENSKSLMIYSNFLFEDTNYEIQTASDQTLVLTRVQNLGKPSFGIRTIRNNGWSRELEISDLTLLKTTKLIAEQRNDSLNVSNAVGGYKTNSSDIGLRYEWMKRLHSSKSEKVRMYLGVAVSGGFHYMNVDPALSTNFSSTVSDVKLSSQIIPRITYSFSSRVLLDMNLVADWFSNNYIFSQVDNPRIPVRQRRTTSIDMDLFNPTLHFRIGLSVAI